MCQCANWLRYEKMYRMAIGTLANYYFAVKVVFFV